MTLLQEHQISAAQFREYLFAWVSQSYHEGMITPSTLLADVRRRAGRVRNTGRPRGRPRAADTTIHDVSIAREAPYALDALAQQHARYEAHRTLSAAKVRAGLSPQERRVWEMRCEEDLSYKEIAAREGITEGAVGSVLNRAKKKCVRHSHQTKELLSEIDRPGAFSFQKTLLSDSRVLCDE